MFANQNRCGQCVCVFVDAVSMISEEMATRCSVKEGRMCQLVHTANCTETSRCVHHREKRTHNRHHVPLVPLK